MGLSKYINDENLAHLIFSDLKNEIHIENSNVLIPNMSVSSNITDISISGTHSFDQKINYQVVVPFRIKSRQNNDEFFGAIEDDKDGQTKLFLKITGTTSDYSITYDSQAVKNKIAADLKNEVAELKNAFKKRGEEKKESLGLNEEEYFDWDEKK